MFPFHTKISPSSIKLIACVISALEMAWHPYFNIFTAKTRMEYTEPLNRPLFLALFKQMQVRQIHCPENLEGSVFWLNAACNKDVQVCRHIGCIKLQVDIGCMQTSIQCADASKQHAVDLS